MATKKSSVRKSSGSRASSGRSSRGRAVAKKTSAKESSGKRSTARASRSKYGPKMLEEVATEMRHLKRGERKNRKQVIAIGLSKTRRAGAKAPPRRKAA